MVKNIQTECKLGFYRGYIGILCKKCCMTLSTATTCDHPFFCDDLLEYTPNHLHLPRHVLQLMLLPKDLTSIMTENH